jgi:hypothetical protein
MAPAITARAIYSKAIKSRSGHLPSSPPSEKTTARQDQTRQASADDGTGDGACNLDIVDAHIEEGYVISFRKAYLIDARSQRPEGDAIGCPRIGIRAGIRPRTVQNLDDIGGTIVAEITTVVKRTTCIIIGKEISKLTVTLIIPGATVNDWVSDVSKGGGQDNRRAR